jgi:hypothetical protein
MLRILAPGIAFALILSLGLVTARRVDAPAAAQPPPVSMSPASEEPKALEGTLAARIEVDGEHFLVYVGEVPPHSGATADTWSIAVPARP